LTDAAAGVSFDNVVKLTTFVTDRNMDKMKLVSEGRARACEKLGVTLQAPGTLIGVAALYAPDLLVEVEAIAVID
jgi:enamine deaminase RidA (YjgF/YER057c/UK114 family)